MIPDPNVREPEKDLKKLLKEDDVFGDSFIPGALPDIDVFHPTMSHRRKPAEPLPPLDFYNTTPKIVEDEHEADNTDADETIEDYNIQGVNIDGLPDEYLSGLDWENDDSEENDTDGFIKEELAPHTNLSGLTKKSIAKENITDFDPENIDYTETHPQIAKKIIPPDPAAKKTSPVSEFFAKIREELGITSTKSGQKKTQKKLLLKRPKVSRKSIIVFSIFLTITVGLTGYNYFTGRNDFVPVSLPDNGSAEIVGFEQKNETTVFIKILNTGDVRAEVTPTLMVKTVFLTSPKSWLTPTPVSVCSSPEVTLEIDEEAVVEAKCDHPITGFFVRGDGKLE